MHLGRTLLLPEPVCTNASWISKEGTFKRAADVEGHRVMHVDIGEVCEPLIMHPKFASIS